uniref:Uncharacterized protein n=1 Tax=Cannabis sativa TaxID=3483 RepID=A0A803R562_CANSA
MSWEISARRSEQPENAAWFCCPRSPNKMKTNMNLRTRRTLRLLLLLLLIVLVLSLKILFFCSWTVLPLCDNFIFFSSLIMYQYVL